MKAAAIAVSSSAWRWGALAKQWRAISALALVVAVVELYEIEGATFAQVLWLASGGFVLSLVLPLSYRLPLFALLSIVGVFAVFGIVDGAWLIATGLLLIGVCHLPLSQRVRIMMLLAIAAGLAFLRAGVADSPWSAAIWPILGSMFMFRLILYVRALKTEKADPSLWGALAYFFMLPNVAFPLFPVVDYQTFRRTHFDRDETEIYEQGLLWVARGLVHLVIYRLVYHHVLIDPVDVIRLSDLVQLMLGTFLLYLKVSGQFHLIVGLLHLFGFRLPETHKLYYLAHSFTELWRRINIYWTDFMMKSVFYPMYFKVKRFGPRAAVALATGAVFATTWLLHSYQWFWLRGGFPLTAQDLLFWGILGALVVRGALRELDSKKTVNKQAANFDLRLGVRAGCTFLLFCFLWSLWSSESVGQWIWTLGAAASVDAKGILMIAAVFAVIVALGGHHWESSKPSENRLLTVLRRPQVRTLVPLVLLVALAQPLVLSALPHRVENTLASLRGNTLNARDAALHHRGYYEQLDVRAQLAAPTVAADGRTRHNWQDPASAGIIRERFDLIERDLHPSLSIDWNGRPFSTNSMGMRDREYSVEKPPETLRVALIGPSHVMGNGVGDGETFEQLLEQRLNEERAQTSLSRVEILNFAVDGFTLPQQLAMLQDRVLQFSPDVVIVTHYHRGSVMTERYLSKIVRKGVSIEDPELRSLLAQAGVADLDQGNIAIPFEAARTAAKSLGMSPRMPQAEFDARIHRIADDVTNWAIERIAAVASEADTVAVVLALNAVIEDAPRDIPNRDAIAKAGLPVLDLFDIFPAERRLELRVAPWDEHPNAVGHQLIADRLHDQLLAVLRQVAQTRTLSSSAAASPE